ncbi:MAG: PEP-CTERM sorting domain-containing protein [Verrucomicrobiaceae bacterium]|nr:MAG: PEP-CTERM sorting domain-containing protein [Verrucomicrobiaceae bacterium]
MMRPVGWQPRAAFPPRFLPAPRNRTQPMKTRNNPFDLSITLALFPLIALPASAQQASNSTWTGATDNNWNEASNWTPSTVPGTGSNAGIQNGNTVQLSTNPASAIDQLLINSTSILDLTAQLSITGPTSGHGLYVGANGGSGILNVGNGGSLGISGGNVGVGRGQTGLVTLAAGGSIMASAINEFHLGWDGGGTGTITQSGGTFTKTGGGDLRIGAFGGSGIYNISGGTANMENLRISYAGSGTGTVNQTGGTVINTGELAVGWASSGNATYNISAGSLTSSQRIRFGIGNGVRTNLINQTGGSVTVTDGRIDIGENAGPTNTYSISGGSVTVNGDGRILVGAFNDSTGNLNVSGTGVVDVSGIVLGDGGSAAGTVNLNGGTVRTNRIVSGGSSSTQHLNLNGGTIVAKSSEGNMISGGKLVVDLQAGGVTIDSNGFDIGISVPLSGVGSLTKTGTDQLKLLGANTYTGNTVVNEGILTLIDSGSLAFKIGADGVNNQITGDGGGVLNLFGKLNFDLANAASQGMWNIVDTTNLAGVNYGIDFGVTGWTDAGSNVWTFDTGSSFYSFNGADGILTAVPEPGSMGLACAGLGLLVAFRRRGR